MTKHFRVQHTLAALTRGQHDGRVAFDIEYPVQRAVYSCLTPVSGSAARELGCCCLVLPTRHFDAAPAWAPMVLRDKSGSLVPRRWTHWDSFRASIYKPLDKP